MLEFQSHPLILPRASPLRTSRRRFWLNGLNSSKIVFDRFGFLFENALWLGVDFYDLHLDT